MFQENTANVRAQRMKQAVHRYICVARLHHATVEGRVSRLGFHHSQHRTLMHLAKNDRIPSQKELAEAMGVSPAAVTATLQRLEKDGYIARTMPDSDNRRYEICITEAGREAVEAGRAIFEEIDRAMFEGFSDEEVAQLESLLSRMQANLAAESDSAPGLREKGSDTP